MKKIIALVTALVFALTLGAAAFAQEQGAAPAAPAKMEHKAPMKAKKKVRRRHHKKAFKKKAARAKKKDAAPAAPVAN